MIHLYEDVLGARFLYPEGGTQVYWAWDGMGTIVTFDAECQALLQGAFEEAREDILTPAEVLKGAAHLATWKRPGVWGLDVDVQPMGELMVYLYGPSHLKLVARQPDPWLC